MPYKDPTSVRAKAAGRKHARLWRKRHPEKKRLIDAEHNARKKANRYHPKRNATTRAWIDTFKVKPCTDCGKSYPPYVMQFDHITGTKIKDISKMVIYSRKRILEEMAKCELVCANCHCERTWSRKQINLNINVE